MPPVPGLTAASERVDGAGSRRRVALIACGAIAQPCKEVVSRRDLPVDVLSLPPLLHNRPERIAGEVRGKCLTASVPG